MLFLSGGGELRQLFVGVRGGAGCLSLVALVLHRDRLPQ